MGRVRWDEGNKEKVGRVEWAERWKYIKPPPPLPNRLLYSVQDLYNIIRDAFRLPLLQALLSSGLTFFTRVHPSRTEPDQWAAPPPYSLQRSRVTSTAPPTQRVPWESTNGWPHPCQSFLTHAHSGNGAVWLQSMNLHEFETMVTIIKMMSHWHKKLVVWGLISS